MLPDSVLSTSPIPSPFLVPRRHTDVDFELGGVDIENTSQGMLDYLWQSELLSNGVRLINTNNGVSRVYLTDYVVDYCSFAFDQNMRPCIVFQSGGLTYLYWYDPTTASQSILSLGLMEYPQISLDDARLFNLNNSDIILAYFKDDTLYYRLQRERYMLEHTLGVYPNHRLLQIGMCVNLRFRFQYSYKTIDER